MSRVDSPLSWGLANAVENATILDIAWVEVPVPEDDLILMVPADALRMPFPQAGGRVMRAPCSYREQVVIARDLWCVSATCAWGRAIWKAAPVKQRPVELVTDAASSLLMGTLGYLKHAEDLRDEQMAGVPPGSWGRGACKGWYTDPMMMEQSPDHGACNMGFIHEDGRADQNPGGRHDYNQIDYSQLCLDLCARWARRISDGSWVDLLEVQCRKFPALAARLRREYGEAPPRPDA